MNLSFDLSSVLSFTVSPLELMLRGTLKYWVLFVVLRFILRPDVAALGITDFLFVVILGDAAQNGMIGSATSATDGMTCCKSLSLSRCRTGCRCCDCPCRWRC